MPDRSCRLGNRAFSGLVARLFGRRINDVLSGDKVMSRRFVQSFPIVLCTGIMLTALLALTCGVLLQSVKRGQREIKRLLYLQARQAE